MRRKAPRTAVSERSPKELAAAIPTWPAGAALVGIGERTFQRPNTWNTCILLRPWRRSRGQW
jgi:hypothetical protein